MDWKCFLLGVEMVCAIGSALDVPEGCVVQDSLTISPLEYDSVRFEAYVRDSLPVFTAKMSCDDPLFYDILKMTANHTISLEEMNSHDLYESKANSLDYGWHNFDLQVVGDYILQDNRNHVWLPDGLEVKCAVTKLVIEDGLLMRHCPESSPAWKISGSRREVLPLTATKTQVRKDELVLFSRTSFLPVFEVGKLSVILGWENEALKAVKDEDVGPLPPLRQHKLYLELTTDSENGHMIQVSDGSHSLLSEELKIEPENLQVSERSGRSFTLIQKSREGQLYWEDIGNSVTTDDHGLTEVYRAVRVNNISPDMATISGLSFGLLITLCLVVGCGVRVFQLNRTVKKNKIPRKGAALESRLMSTVVESSLCHPASSSTLPNLPRHTKHHDSLYLQPRPAKVPSWVPEIPADPDVQIPEVSKDLPEAIYEEIDAYQYMALEGKNSVVEEHS